MVTFSERVKVHGGNLRTLMGAGQEDRRKVARRYAFDAIRQVSPAVVTDIGAHRYLVATTDKALGRETFSSGEYDYEMMTRSLERVEQHIGFNPTKGKVFVDVGANIGTTSIPAAASWGASRVVAVEPAADNYRLLRCNAILNGVDSLVTAVHAAVAVESGSLQLELSESNSGDHRVRRSDQRGDYGESSRETIEVRCAPLDEILADAAVDARDVGLLWIDTQGFEAEVLSSAPSTLEQGVPAVIEYWPYGLERTSGLEALHKQISRHFKEVVDLRTGDTFVSANCEERLRSYTGHSYTELALLPG